MAKTDSRITVARLRELLAYSKRTGILRWRHKRGNIKAGAIAGGLNDQGYILLRVDDIALRAHRVAWAIVMGEFPKNEIDHANRVRSDNRWKNLRDVSHAGNHQNLTIRKDCKHGFRGIELHSSGLWRARITVNGKCYRLGYFYTPQEAVEARLQGERKYHTNPRVY